MNHIISIINKDNKDYNFLKLGFITRIIEGREKIDIKSILSETEIILYNDYIKRFQKYDDEVGLLYSDINGKIKKEIGFRFFTNSFPLDSNNFSSEIIGGTKFFKYGYIGALAYLHSHYLENKNEIFNSIKKIITDNNENPSPIAEKWGFSETDIDISTNWQMYVEYLLDREIKGFKDFLKAIDELQVIQTSLEFSPHYKILLKEKKDIEDSIKYAKRIQESLLPNIDAIHNRLRGLSVFYKPKDQLSGDFFFYREFKDLTIIGCGDCTGHGVPGALLTVLSINIMNQILDSTDITKITPSIFLKEVDAQMTNTLNRNYNEFNTKRKNLLTDLSEVERYDSKESVSILSDGLELGICFIYGKQEIIYSGAGISLYILNNNKITEIKQRTNRGIGGLFEFNKTFEETRVNCNSNDVYFLTTDGIIDQFGGDDGRKLMKKRFVEILEVIGYESLISSLKWSFFLDAWLNGCSHQSIISDFKKRSFTFGSIINLNFHKQIDDITIVTFQV